MSREIKFRAWNGSAMEYGGFLIHATGAILPDSLLSKVNHDSPIMQFSGLQDKNGKDIYESDIVNFWHDDYESEKEVGKVAWGYSYPAFDVYKKNINFKSGFESLSEEYNIFSSPEYTFEIIGNIYKNKDLL